MAFYIVTLKKLFFMDYVTIGVNIRNQRFINGLNQFGLAREVGLSRIMISRYENAQSKMSYEMLERFAEKLGVSVEDLMGKKNPN